MFNNITSTLFHFNHLFINSKFDKDKRDISSIFGSASDINR